MVPSLFLWGYNRRWDIEKKKKKKSVGGILFTERETIIKILGRNRKEKE